MSATAKPPSDCVCVRIGLGEATATGNLISQIMRDEGINLSEARRIVEKSFDIREVYKA